MIEKEYVSPRTGKKMIIQIEDISPLEKEIIGIRMNTSVLRTLNKHVYERKAISLESYLEMERLFRERETKEIEKVVRRYARIEKQKRKGCNHE